MLRIEFLYFCPISASDEIKKKNVPINLATNLETFSVLPGAG